MRFNVGEKILHRKYKKISIYHQLFLNWKFMKVITEVCWIRSKLMVIGKLISREGVREKILVSWNRHFLNINSIYDRDLLFISIIGEIKPISLFKVMFLHFLMCHGLISFSWFRLGFLVSILELTNALLCLLLFFYFRFEIHSLELPLGFIRGRFRWLRVRTLWDLSQSMCRAT